MIKNLSSQRLFITQTKSAFFVYLIAFLFLPVLSLAQNHVSGTVKDNNGKPLTNVSVVVKNTRMGTATDVSGNFSIAARPNDVLVFSFTGYETKEIHLNNQTKVSVSLHTKANSLDEVVVIGYGSVKKKDMTGAVGSVKMADLEKAPVRNFEDALAGRVAGVTASADDGQPGASVNIVIRGSNSLTQDNSPLYVIDGFPMENPDNNAINPAEIESIEVLKDASSTAIYGARGANGVILITTKKGKIGKPVINFNTYYGLQQYTKKMKMMSPYEYVKYASERNPVYADSTYFVDGKTLDDFKNIKGVDLQDSLLGSNPFQNYFLSLSGGSNGTRYSISGSASNQSGIIVNSGYDRYQGRMRLDQKVNEHLNVGINTNYSNLNMYGTSPALGGNGFYYGNLLFSVWAFRPVAGVINQADDGIESDDADFIGALQGFNPIKTAKNELRKKVSDILTTDAYAEYSFAKFFKLRVTGGLTKSKVRTDAFDNSLTPRGSPLTNTGKDNGVSGSVIYDELSSWLNENTLTFEKKLNADNELNVLAGFTMQGTNVSSYGAAANHIPNEQLGTSGIDEGTPVYIHSTSSLYTLASFLGRVNYSYRSKYLLTGSIRADGSSKFAPQNRWSYFPSGAVAWRISQENFMKSINFISNAKVRVSYGATGNNRVTDFAYLSRISIPASGGYAYDNVPVNASTFSILGNENLKWETTAQSDIGLDLGFFNERISLNADVYKKVTSNLLLNAAVPGSIGFTTALKNIGKVQNEGIEFTLNTINISNKNFNWNSNFNISFNRNKLLALSEGETQRLTTASWNTLTSSVPLYIAQVGKPLAMFYGFIWEGNYQLEDFDKSSTGTYTLKDGIPKYSSTVQPGFIKYKDVNGDGIINTDDQTVIGNPNPKFTGGFSNNFTYKHFDLNVFFNFSVGGDVINANRLIFEGGGYNNGQNMYAVYANHWTPDNPSNTYYAVGGAGPDNMSYSTRVIEDGSYLKLKTVQLGYNFSSTLLKRIKITNLRVYASAQNLYTWTKYTGFDPEVSKFGSSALQPAFDYSVYPYARTVTFGLNVSF
jgi:TonB-dependent starch-binding outer membrane protein SusC